MSRNMRATFLRVVSAIFFLYAMLWGLAPFTDINLPARLILDVSDWPIDSLSSQLDRNTVWLSSIGAGLLAAVSVILYGIVVPAIREGNQEVIRTTIIAMLAWYLVDGVGSIAAGVESNVFFNTIYLIFVLIPLVFEKNHAIQSQE